MVLALTEYSQLAGAQGRSIGTSGRPATDALVEMSVRWVLQRSFVAGTVVGARTPEQLSAVVNASLCERPLTPDILHALDSIHQRFPNPCP